MLKIFLKYLSAIEISEISPRFFVLLFNIKFQKWGSRFFRKFLILLSLIQNTGFKISDPWSWLCRKGRWSCKHPFENHRAYFPRVSANIRPGGRSACCVCSPLQTPTFLHPKSPSRIRRPTRSLRVWMKGFGWLNQIKLVILYSYDLIRVISVAVVY